MRPTQGPQLNPAQTANPQNCELINDCCLKSINVEVVCYPAKANWYSLFQLKSNEYDLPLFFKGGSSTVFNSKSLLVGWPTKCFFRVQLLAWTILKLLEHSKHVVNAMKWLDSYGSLSVALRPHSRVYPSSTLPLSFNVNHGYLAVFTVSIGVLSTSYLSSQFTLVISL